MGSSRRCACCTKNVTITILLVVGIILIVGGCVLLVEFPKIVENQIKKVSFNLNQQPWPLHFAYSIPSNPHVKPYYS